MPVKAASSTPLPQRRRCFALSREQKPSRRATLGGHRMLNNQTVAARARSAGFSSRTLWNEIFAGRGPVVTCLSPRRRIISDNDWAQWLASRRDRHPITGKSPYPASTSSVERAAG
jgi:hypothetical protein